MRSIVHLDADAFFASVEQASDPRLRGRPVAVGGEKRGVIASASYEARRFGVYTPMPTAGARKLCPQLILLPGDFEKYEQFSRWMFSYAYDFTPEVEISSIDEGYFDLSGARQPARFIADKISKAISQSLKISVSEGLASNKLVSQIASKLRKPAAFTEVPPGQETAFLHPLPHQWLPGIGPQTARQLLAAGLVSIGQLAVTPTELLELLLGRQAPVIRQFANGIDERPIVPVSAPARSYSQQETFAQDTTDEDYLQAWLRRMADQLMSKVRADGKSIRTLTVKVRYNDRDEDQAGESLNEPTDLETDIYGHLPRLLRQAWQRRVSLRLVALKFSRVYDSWSRLELGLDADSRRQASHQRLAAVIDELRQRHGRQILRRGHDFQLDPPAAEARVKILQFKAKLGLRPARRAEVRGQTAEVRGQTAEVRGQTAEVRGQTAEVRGQTAEDRRQTAEGRGQTAEDRRQTVAVQGEVLREAITAYGAAAPKLTVTPSPSSWSPDYRTPTPRSSPSSRVTTYVPLAAHSYYSFLDSTLSIEALIGLAREHRLPAIALTDTGHLHGAVEFFQTARRAGIQPVIGVELRWQGKPLRLYVENAQGYHHLCRLLSLKPKTEPGRNGVPRPERRRPTASSPPPGEEAHVGGRGLDLAQVTLSREALEGLIAVGTDPRPAELFPGRFYLAVTGPETPRPGNGGPPLPRVACPDIRYAAPEDRWKYDVVQSIRTRTLLRQEHPDKRRSGAFHFRSARELGEWFRAQPQWLDNTLAIAERCQFDLPLGQPQFPAYVPPDGSTPRDFLRQRVLTGLRERYGTSPPRISHPQTALSDRKFSMANLEPQIETELDIIHEVGYEGYFLAVWDLLRECRRRGIEWLTRGSAADSLVCYCLGISSVCPIRFGLYFRRFLNRERMRLNKLPDIDLDFPHDRKDDVLDLIFEKYGAEHAAVVGGFSTFRARGAVGDVAKVLGVSEYQARRFTEHFPHAGPRGLQETLRVSQECRDLPLTEDPYATALQMAEFLDGFPRYPKMHPCGVVLSCQPMAELTPTFPSHKGYPTTHFDMDAVEALGLVKIDILAQGGLAVMRDVKTAMSARGLALDLERLTEPWTDPAVWEMIAGGGARAVHHIESPAMIGLCRQSHVHEIDGLIAIVSVIRPGAANEQKKLRFTRRYQGFEPVTYPDPSLVAALSDSFGLVIYEEHVLQICEAFAGLPAGRADLLRRALGKSRRSVIAEIRDEFFAAARQRGHAESRIGEVWDLVEGFAGYAFCKAHSTAYGVEAYQSAWLKRYYPAEFMAAVLSNGKGFYHPLVYVLECHRLGLPMQAPWINEPGPAFQVVPAQAPRASPPGEGPPRSQATVALRVPVTRVKGLTRRTVDQLLRERQRAEFRSLADFYRRVAPAPEELESLIRVGAFDGFGPPRTAQYWESRFLCRAYGPSAEPSQGWLLPPPGLERLPETPLVEPTRRQQLENEAELLDFPASGHPLELYPDIAWDTYCPVSRLGQYPGETVVTCGLVIEQRVHHQITGEPMKFLTLADWTGMVETELFAPTYRSFGLATIRYPVLEVTATVEPFENQQGFSLRVHRAGKPRTRVIIKSP